MILLQLGIWWKSGYQPEKSRTGIGDGSFARLSRLIVLILSGGKGIEQTSDGVNSTGYHIMLKGNEG